uniref:Uncharacterized protein n=1 Tax=Arundo donax TaxID=35708 RepID=A0A0A9BMM1_ARUDO
MPSDSSIFLVPQAIILVCRAVKRPRLNIAIPSPPSESILTELLTINGSCIRHLKLISAQIRPMRLAYMLGFIASFLPTTNKK